MGVLAVSMVVFFGLKAPNGTEGKKIKVVKDNEVEL
jgi:hypothetical protein